MSTLTFVVAVKEALELVRMGSELLEMVHVAALNGRSALNAEEWAKVKEGRAKAFERLDRSIQAAQNNMPQEPTPPPQAQKVVPSASLAQAEGRSGPPVSLPEAATKPTSVGVAFPPTPTVKPGG